MKAVPFFETSGSNYPTTRRNKPEDLLPQYENKFATHKLFQRSAVSSG
jgi:hypothetical protein